MQFQTLYDLQTDGCRYGFLPAYCALLAVASAVHWYIGKRRADAVDRNRGGLSAKMGSIFLGALAALTFIVTWGDYWHLSGKIRTGDAPTIEGAITDFHAAANIKDTESFQLDGHLFSYKKYATRQGFNTLRLEGSPLANGKVIRIRYVSGQIVKLEIAR